MRVLEDDPTLVRRRTFAGFATRTSGKAEETRGRFLIETERRGNVLEGGKEGTVIETDGLSLQRNNSTLKRSVLTNDSTCVFINTSNVCQGQSKFADFVKRDKHRLRKRLQLFSSSITHQKIKISFDDCWNHLGSAPIQRIISFNEPLIVTKAIQISKKTAEFPTVVAPIIIRGGGGDNGTSSVSFTRKALTSLLPNSRKRFPDPLYVLGCIYLNVIDEREVRACLILHAAFGLPLPAGLSIDPVSQRAPDFIGNLSNGLLKKRAYAPLLCRIFLRSIEKNMNWLVQMLIEAGFPKSMDEAIFTNDSKNKHQKGLGSKLLPSYFIIAVALKRTTIVRIMISKGANVNKTWFGLSPLILAACCGPQQQKASTIISKLLLEAGAKPLVGITSGQFMRLLFPLKRHFQDGATIVKISSRSVRKLYPLDFACASKCCDAAINILSSMSPNRFGWDCTIAVLAQTDLDIMIRLIKFGANVNVVDMFENTALHAAARLGKVDLLAVLLHAGAMINASNIFGWTALHEAAAGAHHAAIQYLIGRGANCSLRDNHGDTALQVALKQGIPADEILDYFAGRLHPDQSLVNDDINELLSQVDLFELSSETPYTLNGSKKTKRRFLIEKIIALPKWLSSSIITNKDDSKNGADREKACK